MWHSGKSIDLSCMTPSKLLNLTELWFTQLQNVNTNKANPVGILQELNEIIDTKFRAHRW